MHGRTLAGCRKRWVRPSSRHAAFLKALSAAIEKGRSQMLDGLFYQALSVWLYYAK
jgi:hypothetical protein